MSDSQELEMTDQAYQDLDPEKFVDLCLSFPCFAEAKLDMPHKDLLSLILKAYNEDTLTEAQDLVVELLFHLRDENMPFNLKRASKIWTLEDREAFWYLISLSEECSQ